MTQEPTTQQVERSELVDRLYEAAFATGTNDDERAMNLAELILTAASQQIRDETTIESPWFIPHHMPKADAEIRLARQQYAAVERALEITEALRRADARTQVLLVEHFHHQQLVDFPPDGTFRKLRDVVLNILPQSQAGSVLATISFMNDLVEQEDIQDPQIEKQLANVIAKRGPYMPGRVGSVYRSKKAEAEATGEEFDPEATLSGLLEDAEAKSVHQFEEEHRGTKGVAPLRTTRMELNQQGALFVIQAETERQVSILTSRMGTMLDYSDQSLLTPISSNKVLDLIERAAKLGYDQIIPDLMDMLKTLVLGEQVCYDVYQVLQNAPDKAPWMSVGDFKMLRSYSRAKIKAALERLTFFGLIVDDETPTVHLWAKDWPREDGNDGSTSD